ncbi:BOS complex subunit NOMO3 [Cydia pomonella]|uniref:BOS complex subunit NOMO3 n=1 Tax=Cydia pomonella TaxID=82600 RepID=UPI002ADD4D0F|nr:BOS complex subunit NOMO3 [Cydia pomonella]
MGTFLGLRIISLIYLIPSVVKCYGNDILGCGGFVKSHVNLDFSKIEIGLYTKEGSLKEKTECAPNNGYYFLPLYEKGEYVLKVHPPPGWSFEPSEVNLNIDGVTDQCSTGQDVNFSFNGFGITGLVITAGQKQGPAGIAVQLVNDKGEVRNTVTSAGGDFHFTPVIPGKYTVKASHPRWKLEPSSAVVQVKEGNTALPTGVLAVKGYDVKGSVTSNGNPIAGLYVLLYSKEESPKLRVEGCKTALLQGVPDSPICYSTTDNNGEFTFGLVPAGEYKLLALAKSPGQATVSYNVKPESVPFAVLHDSLYIKNAFEVTGFTVMSSVVSTAGAGLPNARVSLDGRAVGKTDSAGKYTLPSLQSGTYTISVEHDQAQFDDVQLSITATGAVLVPEARASRWRVCGAVSPPAARRVLVRDGRVPVDDQGKWCTFLPPGVYTARVDVSEQEQRDGLQYYPLSHKITVSHSSVSDITFSQLKALVSGAVRCRTGAPDLPVTLRTLAPDGSVVGNPLTTTAKDGKYTFKDVLPGSVELSVPSDRLCWAESVHNIVVTQETATVPDFVQTGHVLRATSSHKIEVDYISDDGSEKGTLTLPAGASTHCVGRGSPRVYTLTPRGCHQVNPPTARADTGAEHPQPINFIAVAHSVVLRVTSPEPVKDLVLKIGADGHGARAVGPLKPQPRVGGGYVFEHELFMKEGEVAVVSAESSTLLFNPSEPQQVIGSSDCQPQALTIRAVKGLSLAGRIIPPVAGVTVTLTSDDLELTQTTTTAGTYSFGPLDASKQYAIACAKESYVFRGPDAAGHVRAHKLAEIIVELLDDADGKPLQGALVSVSGGSYRRNLVSGPSGSLRFSSLAPAEYYAKPLMKEYKFSPPHEILTVQEGREHKLTLRGVRVAWSCVGHLVSLGGVGWAGASVVARAAGKCASEEATTEAGGAFRIRGLLPGCVYSLQLKDSTTPELAGLKLVKAPSSIQVKNNQDITDVQLIAIQPQQITDTNVLVYTPNIDHYKTLRLTLALESTPDTPIYSTKLDSAGYSQTLNPGLMYVLPRLPADNKTYIVQLESTLSKATHSYEEVVSYFNSDGQFKYFNLEFLPKVKSSEQELRQTSLLVVPLFLLLALAYHQRASLLAHVTALASQRPAPTRPTRARPDVLDHASIDQIVSSVNAAGKKKKQ